MGIRKTNFIVMKVSLHHDPKNFKRAKYPQ